MSRSDEFLLNHTVNKSIDETRGPSSFSWFPHVSQTKAAKRVESIPPENSIPTSLPVSINLASSSQLDVFSLKTISGILSNLSFTLFNKERWTFSKDSSKVISIDELTPFPYHFEDYLM